MRQFFLAVEDVRPIHQYVISSVKIPFHFLSQIEFRTLPYILTETLAKLLSNMLLKQHNVRFALEITQVIVYD